MHLLILTSISLFCVLLAGTFTDSWVFRAPGGFAYLDTVLLLGIFQPPLVALVLECGIVEAVQDCRHRRKERIYWARRRNVERIWKETYLGLRFAALVRGWLSRRRLARAKQGVTAFQAQWRMKLAIRFFEEEKLRRLEQKDEMKAAAACLIQARWRQYTLRNRRHMVQRFEGQTSDGTLTSPVKRLRIDRLPPPSPLPPPLLWGKQMLDAATSRFNVLQDDRTAPDVKPRRRSLNADGKSQREQGLDA